MVPKEWMSTVKYTTDCATISLAVLSEVLRYAQTRRVIETPLTVIPSTESFRLLGSSFLRRERRKTSKVFSSIRRLPGSSSSIFVSTKIELSYQKSLRRERKPVNSITRKNNVHGREAWMERKIDEFPTQTLLNSPGSILPVPQLWLDSNVRGLICSKKNPNEIN